MNKEIINPLYEATQDVFKLMFDLDTEKNGIEIIEDMVQSNDANVVLGVTGDLKGSIIFGFTKEMAIEMVKIMSGMEIEEIDGFASSALGEVANIIGGNTMTILSSNNRICDIVPPQVFVGDYKTLSLSDEKATVLNMKTKIGDFEIIVFLRSK